MQDKTGKLWFATDGDGVFCYDPSATLNAGRKSFARLTERDGLPDNYVRSIVEDKSGNLWFSTRAEGVCRYDGKSFTQFTADEGQHIGRADGWGAKDKKETLWFGARDGIYCYDPLATLKTGEKPFTFWPLPMDAADTQLRQSQPGYNLTAYSVYSILEDKSGNQWFGTEQKGICRYDGRSFTWFRELGLDKGAVRALFEDKAGNIWAGTNGRGVYRFNGKTFTNFSEEKGLSNFLWGDALENENLKLNRVWSIAEDKAGNFWFATIDEGVWRFDGKTFANFTMKDGLASNAVWTIFEDKAGTLWFGVEGGGLCQYDGKSFVNFTQNDAGQ